MERSIINFVSSLAFDIFQRGSSIMEGKFFLFIIIRISTIWLSKHHASIFACHV